MESFKTSSIPKRLPLQRILEGVSEDKHPFYTAVLSELPPVYTLAIAGISRLSAASSPAFCSPFRVKALVRREGVKGWSFLIELVNPDDEIVECVIPASKFDGKPREAIAILADHGFRLYDGYQKDTVFNLIRNWPVTARQSEVDQFGWTSDHAAFILTSGRVIARDATSSYRYMGTPDGKEIGDLIAWQRGVAALSLGNTNLVFGCALGLSTALLTFTELNSVIYHLYQKTSKGKTRVLAVALTCWPKIGEKYKTWDATINGIEGEIARSNSILLGLDELPKDATSEFGNMIYKIANSVGKARSEKDGTAVRRKTWQTAVISTGEHSMLDTLKALGKITSGGQGVRMLDIPALGTHGLFDDLHGCKTSDAFIKVLDRSIRKVSGPAGTAFVQRLMAQPVEDLQARLDADAEEQATALQDHLGVVAGDEKTTEIRRVLESFAIVAVAGEWASEWGITGWPPGAASEAVREIALRWLTKRGTMPLDQAEVIRKTRDYLAEHEHRFVPLADRKRNPRVAEELAGYCDATYFYVLSQTTGKIYEEGKISSSLDYLLDAGYLSRGTEKDSLQFKMSPIDGKRPRSYRIRRTILDFQNSNDASSAAEVEDVE